MLAWRPGRHASTHPPPLQQGAALQVEREKRVHQKALRWFRHNQATARRICYNTGKHSCYEVEVIWHLRTDQRTWQVPWKR